MPRLIAALALLLTATIAADARPIHIVAFGDSLTSGYLVPRGKAYPAQLQAVLRAKGYDVTVKNAGIAGDTTKGALKRFDLAVDPDTAICILEFGLNDRRAGVAMAQVQARLTTLIRTLHARRIEVLLVGAGGLNFADLAKRNGAAYVAWKLPRHKFRARDGAHYNAEGYKIVVGQMLSQVETLLAKTKKQ